ncbi:PEP/pyruvate-binding domain-containing protein [Acetonema longum]|uniref:Phosphoenolpyruvate synthase n=1 Tax=Acetonema longum DSM 6540 TaxID=1009370 RepID=F7NJK6_9FIRM|nr:PEP/pyruvate-binding domain-containing protein [Acetonema longum]EGO63772.1 phosphoenolpyruvate synthase [Acetonema longum DSM 6540]
MHSFMLSFQEIDKTKRMAAGGKGANLGELSRIDGIQVPDGFCVTTEAYKRITDQSPAFNVLLDGQILSLTRMGRKIEAHFLALLSMLGYT